MTLKDELLQTTEDGDVDMFISFMSKHQNRYQIQDLEEALNSLSTLQLADVWEKVHNMCTSVLLNLDGDGDNESEENVQKNKQMLNVLQSIVTLATAALSSDTPAVPDCFYDTAVLMHGILLSLPLSADKLKNSMAKLFETWWTRDLEGKEELGVNSLTYLLERSLQDKPVLADVKRVWSMRMAVKLVDLLNPNSDHLLGLLLQCFIHVSYLKHEEGRRFLSFLFSLGTDVIQVLHNTMKNHLPTIPRSLQQHYGEVYFRAWRGASGECLQKIENHCIQDLMHLAVHASRQSSRSLAHVLRKVLGYIHDQKKQKGVDEMLLRLYEPILWRSLKVKVANGVVRANAASLLVDVFPLQNSETILEETDLLLQKQFDLLQSLLYDPCVPVRTVIITGVCRIIPRYWEYIPETVIRALITSLYHDHVYDASSADVRVAVIMGQLQMLDNHLCHPLLKPLLPNLQNCIHDHSEKVRISMLELLIKVRSIRGIKFWSVVPMEHILARLEIDSPYVARHIMKLIFSTFVPMDKGSEGLLTRCISLIRSNPGAARNFFQHASNFMTLEEAVKYIICLCRAVLISVRKEQKKSQPSPHTSNENGERVSDEELEDNDKENADNASEVTVEDTDLITGLLEAMAILWSSISKQLSKEENKELNEGLRRKFAIAMPEFLHTFHDRQAYSALLLLSSLLPPELVPHYSRSCLSHLKDMPEESEPEDYGMLLEAMCKWVKMGELVELIIEWLQDGLKILEPSNSSGKTKKKGKKTVAFIEPRTPQPILALKYLSYLMSDALCQKILLANCKTGLQELSTLLGSVTKCIEMRFTTPTALGPRTTDDFLTQAFTKYQILEILLHQSPDDADQQQSLESLEQLYAWADRELLSALAHEQLDESSASRKRELNEDTTALRILATNLVKSLLNIGCNVMLLGLGNAGFISNFIDFVNLSLLVADGTELIPLAGQALYQLIESWRFSESETCSYFAMVTTLYSKLLQTMAGSINRDDQPLTEHQQEQVDDLLTSMKPTMNLILQAVYKCTELDTRLVSDIMASTIAAVISDLTHHSKTRKLDQDELCESLSDMPSLSAFFLTIVSKKNYMTTSFLEELDQCIRSGAVLGLNGLNGVVYLTANLHHNKPSLSGLKDCLVSLQVQADILGMEMSDYDQNSPDRMLLTGLLTRLRQTQDEFVSG